MIFLDNSKCYYDVLDVPKDADQKAIQKAYRKLSKRYHPDLNGGDNYCEEQFKQIVAAYETLGDPEKRAHYNSLIPTEEIIFASADDDPGYSVPYQKEDPVRPKEDRAKPYEVALTTFLKYLLLWLIIKLLEYLF